MGIDCYTQQEAKDLFRGYLWDVVTDSEVRSHMVDMLDRILFAREKTTITDGKRTIKTTIPSFQKMLPVQELIPDSVTNNKFLEKGRYGELVDRGDGYLFLCGFYPEYTSSMRRSSPGMDFYIKKGQDCYSFACSLADYRQHKDHEPSLVLRLLNGFTQNINALIEMRSRFKEEEIMFDPSVYEELHKHTGYTGKVNHALFVEAGYNNVRFSTKAFEIQPVGIDDLLEHSLKEARNAAITFHKEVAEEKQHVQAKKKAMHQEQKTKHPYLRVVK
jgi:hypothetical protein